MVSSAINQDDPFERMKSVVVFYLSGFYKKPKGLKKPYNPILGEYFRCYWQHPSGTKTFYIAEQVSHHPPISAFHVTNRSEGFAISGTILAKSKFYGTSVSAFFDGSAKLSLLSKGEDYEMTFPYAFCKGILFGTLSMELGGKVQISCEKTGYQTDIEFKLKPYLFGAKDCNAIMGQITLGAKVLATIDGKWDSEIFLTDHRSKTTPQKSKIWEVTKEVTRKRLPRYLVDFADQNEFESEKLWKKVDRAILAGDQVLATEEKYVLEERQRNEAKERSKNGTQWVTRFFKVDLVDPKMYVYKYQDYRPWDKDNDMKQYERNGIIKTLTKHKIAPLVRCSSSHSVMPNQSTLRLGVNGDFQNSLDTPIEGDEETSAEDPWMDSVSETAGKKKLNETSPVRKGNVIQHGRSQNRGTLSTSASRQPIGADSFPSEVLENVNVSRQLAELIEENSKLLRSLQQELVSCTTDRNRANNIMIFIITIAIAVIVQVLYYFSHQFNAK